MLPGHTRASCQPGRALRRLRDRQRPRRRAAHTRRARRHQPLHGNPARQLQHDQRGRDPGGPGMATPQLLAPHTGRRDRSPHDTSLPARRAERTAVRQGRTSCSRLRAVGTVACPAAEATGSSTRGRARGRGESVPRHRGCRRPRTTAPQSPWPVGKGKRPVDTSGFPAAASMSTPEITWPGGGVTRGAAAAEQGTATKGP